MQMEVGVWQQVTQSHYFLMSPGHLHLLLTTSRAPVLCLGSVLGAGETGLALAALMVQMQYRWGHQQ